MTSCEGHLEYFKGCCTFDEAARKCGCNIVVVGCAADFKCIWSHRRYFRKNVLLECDKDSHGADTHFQAVQRNQAGQSSPHMFQGMSSRPA